MIIVYGGTFNPPTKAHEKIANLITKKYRPIKFIFLPVGDAYTWKDNFASFYHRKNMLELVFKADIFEISNLENANEYKGTYWALNQIKETYKNDVYFVLGADNINELDKWIDYPKLVSEYKFIVLTRKGYNVLELIKEKHNSYYKNFSIVEFNLDISAKKFRENPALKSYVNKKVFNYIINNNLYEVNNDKA